MLAIVATCLVAVVVVVMITVIRYRNREGADINLYQYDFQQQLGGSLAVSMGAERGGGGVWASESWGWEVGIGGEVPSRGTSTTAWHINTKRLLGSF